ncbi:hypothetical protein [Alteriqipengyuania sp. 357]
MKTNIPLAYDPFEAANRAYHLLNPDSTGEDWERWVGGTARRANGHFDDFAAYAALCDDALEEVSDMEPATTRMLSYSAGYFDLMESVITGLIDILPTSAHMPHHMDRYRRNLHKFPERYVDYESDNQG